MNDSFDFVSGRNNCTFQNATYDDLRIIYLRKISYGFIMPTICLFGIVGNILNLIVLTRRNMQGTAYIYMRGYSAASLLAIGFCVPFTLRVLGHRENGGWTSWSQAFYHVHLELYLGNGCLGVGAMMLSALTIERHASVCQAGQSGRPVCGPPYLTALLLPLATFLFYFPSVFRAEMRNCTTSFRVFVYMKRDNVALLRSTFYQVYKVLLEVLFKIGPTILIGSLNLRIMLAYRRSCKRRRRMRRNRQEVRSFAEERRLMLLLGSTSFLFLVCVSPMVILNVTLSEDNLSRFPYQVFRALANLLEVINYSMTFYIYCLFSEDFRNTLTRTFECPWTLCSRDSSKISLGTTTPTPTSSNSRPTASKTPPPPPPPVMA